MLKPSCKIAVISTAIVLTLMLSISSTTDARTRDRLPAPTIVGGIPAPACVSYVHHNTLRRTCRGCDCCCKPPMIVMLTVTDPCCCTNVLEIPVCVPACCCDVPKCSSRVGLLGRGRVNYTWCCGYRVEVVFDKCGSVVVHSYGR